VIVVTERMARERRDETLLKQKAQCAGNNFVIASESSL